MVDVSRLDKEIKATIKEGLQETREREEIFRKSLEKGLQETRESLKEDLQETKESLEKSFKETLAQEIKTSQMKIEYNLKKEMQVLQERLKMDINERESKLQKSIDQVQGDVEKMEGKLTKKIEDDIEETKAESGERITEVETNCNHRIAEVTQMQKQCNDAVKGIGGRQNQLAVNLRNAIAVQRKEDNKRVAMEVRQLQQGVQQLESKTEEIDKRISNATLTVGEEGGRTGRGKHGPRRSPLAGPPLRQPPPGPLIHYSLGARPRLFVLSAPQHSAALVSAVSVRSAPQWSELRDGREFRCGPPVATAIHHGGYLRGKQGSGSSEVPDEASHGPPGSPPRRFN
ncbi:shootin-1-like [Schistocerca americana]|uniref:shootin-1-like n=1 Tax=Schistocerca americana TaxID=7009 RepID=UPI001F4FB2AC|nr:shootin-1-like [Schistocerca americana]